MSNIEVGEYIRTHKGIARVIPDGRYVEINEDEKKRMIYVDKNGIPCNWEFGYYVWSNKILKHSKNIIDLIEERRFCEWKASIFYWNSNRKSSDNKPYRRNIYTKQYD